MLDIEDISRISKNKDESEFDLKTIKSKITIKDKL